MQITMLLYREVVLTKVWFIQFQQKSYSDLDKKFDANVLDTFNKNKAEVNQSIFQYVTSIKLSDTSKT